MEHIYHLALAAVALFLQVLPSDSVGLRGQAVPVEEVESSLLLELANSRRSGNATNHIASLEAAMKQTYAAVPREEDGTLNHAVVNYVLHRFFVKQHGWYIQGLEPGTGKKAASAQSEQPQILKGAAEWVPDHLQRFLQKLQGNAGIGLRDLAIIASTIDDLIHKESLAHLDQAFDSIGVPLNTTLDKETASQILEVWMMIFMSGDRFNAKGRSTVMLAHYTFARENKDWGQLQEWVHDFRRKLFPQQDTLSFNEAARVVEEVGRQYATYNEVMCQSLKEELLSIEAKKAGRVRLTEFYRKGLKGLFEFDEKIEYLRHLGVLDESDPKQPHVIVPNYISSRANCLKTSSFYVICCRNECEEYLGSLEMEIGTEMASPEQILKIVAGLSKNLQPNTTKDRLQSIADVHGGLVPLHGRLFAQWMHHMFPRECPYPHASGKINPQTPDEWMQETGQEDSKASEEEMMAHVMSDTCGPDEPLGEEARKHHHFAENELPWDDVEELMQPLRRTERKKATLGGLTTFVMLSSATSLFLLAAKRVLIGLGNRKHVLPYRHWN